MVSIEIKNLSVNFQQQRTNEKIEAIQDLNLSISSGKFICVLGPSGCGKTTLLNVLAGLQKPSLGSVTINSNPIETVNQQSAMVFQSSALLPWRTVLQNISYGLEIQKVTKKEQALRSHEMCQLVGLQGFEQSYPHELSGGMQQRVNLARALVIQPNLLLMDEPFASLDSQMREEMQLEVLKIWQHTKQTVVFVTHDIQEAVFLADEVYVMTSRPGTIKIKITIDLAQPRTYELKKTNLFHQYVDQLRDLARLEFLLQTDQDFKHE